MRLFQIGKTWYVDYTQHGKRYRKSLKTQSKVAATKLLKELERDQVLGRLPTKKSSVTLRKFVQETYLPWGKIHQKPATWQESDYTLRKILAFVSSTSGIVLGDLPLHAIAREHIEEYKIARLDQVSKSTVNSDLQVIRAVLNRAVEWGYLERSPYRGIRHFKVDRSPRTRFLTEDEVQRLFRAARELGQEDPHRYGDIYPLVATAIFAGLRKAELGWLCWEDIDFDLDILTVRGSRQVGDKTVTTKNYQTRSIPLHPELKAILALHRLSAGYCFRPDIDKPVVRRYRYDFRIGIIALTQRAGLPDVTPHVMRHSFGSHLVMAGVDLPTVKELMGHADISTTMIYAHLSQDHKKAAIGKLFSA